MKTITVHASQTYPIWIGRGLLGQCGSYLKQQTKAQTAAVITDDHVDKYYGDIVTSSLEASGFRTLKFVFPHGEASKCSRTLNQIYDFLCENNITRTDCLVALGGGVVGDITGFAAATYLRGLYYLQIPTSCWHRWILPWAERQPSTCPAARTWWVHSSSRWRCCATWIPGHSAENVPGRRHGRSYQVRHDPG